MARPIKETPILKGDDAIRFWEAAENVVPISEEERQEAEKLFQAVVKKNPEIFSIV